MLGFLLKKTNIMEWFEMNNNLLNIITGKDRKRYNQIIQLIDQRNYNALFDMDRDQSFGLSSQKYVDRILDRIGQEVSNNPEFLIQMNQSYYHRANHFNEIAIIKRDDFGEKAGKPNLPIAVFCNGFITEEDVRCARRFNVPIIFSETYKNMEYEDYSFEGMIYFYDSDCIESEAVL